MAKSFQVVVITFIFVQLFTKSCDGNEVQKRLPFLDVKGSLCNLDPRIKHYLQKNQAFQTYKASFQNLLPKNLPKDVMQNISAQYAAGKQNEDVKLDIVDLLKKYGRQVESYQVKTSDGYKLTVYRIPGAGPVVFLMHGLLSSADDYVTSGPESGLAYLLADAGYDVWLGNARGNKHSRAHESRSPDDPMFWDFTWDEIGRRDLPAMIDFVLQKTGQSQLNYVGHSQGTTSFFVMCSELPEYNDKISVMVALSAVAYMSHLKSPLVRLLSPINSELYLMANLVGLNEIFPDDCFMRFLKEEFCGNSESAYLVCENIVGITCGFDFNEANYTNLPTFFSHMPAGSSTKQLVHYGQGVVSGKFQRYDYGLIQNLLVYGTKDPPLYPVEKISAPVAIFYSPNDWLAAISDVETLKGQLPHVVEYYKVPDNYNHMDYLWSKDVQNDVFPKMLELFRKVAKKKQP